MYETWERKVSESATINRCCSMAQDLNSACVCLCVCWLPLLRGARSSCGAEYFDSVSRSLPGTELNGRVSSCAKLWTWRHLSLYLQYTIVKLPTLGINASLTLDPSCSVFLSILLLCFLFYFIASIFPLHTHCIFLSAKHIWFILFFLLQFCEYKWHEKPFIAETFATRVQ